MLALFYVHIGVVLGGAFYFKKKLKKSYPELTLETFLFYWTSVVLSSLALSCFKLLGNHYLMLILPLPLFFFLFYWISPSENFKVATVNSPSLKKLTLLSKVLFFLTATALLILSAKNDLHIPDTLVIKLPNAYFYMQNGNLMPAWHLGSEGRLFATPFNGTLIWMQFLRFSQGPGWIIGLNTFCWFLAAFSLFLWCRELKISRSVSWISVSCILSTLNLMFQATYDGDDLLSSISGVIAGYYLTRFFNRNLSTKDLGLFVIGFGLSFGAKGFTALYIPGILVLLVYLGIKYTRRSLQYLKAHIFALSSLFILLCLLALPFAFVMWKTTGHFTFESHLNAPLANRPFRFAVAFHNIVAYNLQILVSDLIDLLSFSGGNTRHLLYLKLNEIFLPLLPQVESVRAYLQPIHVFHRNVLENDTWFGVFPLCLFILFSLSLWHRKKNKWILWLGIFFISWDIFFSVRTLYIEGLGRYWIIAGLNSVPLFALLADSSLKSTPLVNKITSCVLGFLVLATSAVAFQAFFKNVAVLNRLYLPAAWTRDGRGIPNFSKRMRSILKSDAPLNIVKSTYGLPVYLIIRESSSKRVRFLDKVTADSINLFALNPDNLTDTFTPFRSIALRGERSFQGGTTFVDRSGLNIPWYVYQASPQLCVECPQDSNNLLISIYTGVEREDSPWATKLQLSLPIQVPGIELRLTGYTKGAKSASIQEFKPLHDKEIPISRSFDYVCFEARIKGNSPLNFRRSCLHVKPNLPRIQEEEYY